MVPPCPTPNSLVMGLSHSISTSPISIIESICTSTTTTTTTTPTIPAIASVAPATDAAAPTTHSPKGKWGGAGDFQHCILSCT